MSKSDLTHLIQEYGHVLSCFFDHISDMIFLMAVENGDTFRYVMMNPAAMRVAGLSEEAYGRSITEVYTGKKGQLLNSIYQQAVASGKPLSYIDEEEGGGDIFGESILTPIFNADGICTHVFTVTRDVTERKRLEAKLLYMAYHDMLTDLPNRRLLFDLLDDAMSRAKEYHHLLAVLYLDCDEFKMINDTFGHDIGDEFLTGFAKRLRYCLRDSDILARLGGDEFVVVLPVIHSLDEAVKIAERIVQSLEQPWQIKQHRFPVTVSIGIALYPYDADDKFLLLKRADEALYQAKQQGKNRFKLYCATT
ncbi:GGDEF domain-containing protein [Brevibacillus sp. SYP-B805]|uniref:diguanylate cyclase domain-containing protein n=1 Tax=Brevibacillus sp. SYP-B805 TaxID=1578199 RepID=UPI0013EBB23E|nr:GGDEF domain-containing protein [Brevibacillus sp. SYP-B805]NGQ96569.1 GGDEF domain-containing protein [Brevibacillus sp. SYP-B805]